MPNEFACPACGAKFPTEAALHTHGATPHPMPPAPSAASPLECAACGGIRFHSEAEMHQHAAVHRR